MKAVDCFMPWFLSMHTRMDIILYSKKTEGELLFVIRRDGGDDNQVNILRLQPAGFQSALGGLRPHMGSVLVRGGDAAFHNARAFNNPFVGSVHHLLQIRIGQAAFRNIGTRTDNLDGQSFKGNIRMCGHSFGRMMNRKRPDVLCGNSLKERGPDDQHKNAGLLSCRK